MSQISGPNFGGPLAGNQVGEVFVGVAADLGPLRAGLRQAEAEVKQSAARMQTTAAVPVGSKSAAFAGFRGSGGPGGGADVGRFRGEDLIGEFSQPAAAKGGFLGRIRAATKEAGILRGIVSKIFWPVAILAGTDRLLSGIRDMNRAAEDFRKNIEGISAEPLARVRDALLEIRVLQGQITQDQSDANQLRAQQFDAEKKISEELLARKEHLGTLSGLLETLLKHYKEGFTENPAVLIPGLDILNIIQEHKKKLAEAQKDAEEGIKAIVSEYDTLVKLAKQKAEIEEKARREDRRDREQRKRDITATPIDATRIGPALDLYQRQRTNGVGFGG